MSGLFSDLRQVLRSLARSPGSSAAAILTLAVGGGACTAMLSATYRLLLRPLPFPAPDRLVAIFTVHDPVVALGGPDESSRAERPAASINRRSHRLAPVFSASVFGAFALGTRPNCTVSAQLSVPSS